MAKQIVYGDSSRQRDSSRVNSLADAVKVTSVQGRNVILDKNSGRPRSPRTASPSRGKFELKDALENMGAQMVKEVASRRRTSPATAHHGHGAGPGHLSRGREERHRRANPMAIKRGIAKAVEAIVASLKAQSKPVNAR